MKPLVFPFSAITGQEEMKLALLLAAVDWRISVLLRGDKGAGKTTAARSLADLLPSPSPFINVPIGTTEDRLLGGLHLERTLKGDPALKPGMLSAAHGGVLYVDEINLLPAHLGDALLDTVSSGVNVVEREGLSASHAAEFVLLGSMNPDEGSLRPQLLDRFALAVDVAASTDPTVRQSAVERRIAFDRYPDAFVSDWSHMQREFREQVSGARDRLSKVLCSKEILAQISEAVCAAGVRSLRADLTIVRAAIAYAALEGEHHVRPDHVATILPLALVHRTQAPARPPAPRPQPPPEKPRGNSSAAPSDGEGDSNTGDGLARIFTPQPVETFALRAESRSTTTRGASASPPLGQSGPVSRVRRSETPQELDLRATLNHAAIARGDALPTTQDLHERVRTPRSGTRYLFVIDSSGSHAAQERMRLVKGSTNSLLARSFRNGDEVAIIVFRGTSAQVLLEPTRVLEDASTALEYLPTGGRTPLAHALDLARCYVTPATALVILTDGRANVPLGSGDPWEDALDLARQIKTSALVIDTDHSADALGRSPQLAQALGAGYVRLESPALHESTIFNLQQAS